MRRKDMQETFRAIGAVLKSEDEYDSKLTYALIKNKHRMKAQCEEAQDQMKQFEKTRMQIILKQATKDKDGKPIVEAGGGYAGTGLGLDEAFDAALEKLDEERTAYLREDVPFEIYVIKDAYAPKGKIKANVHDAIFPLIESEQNDDSPVEP